LPREVLSSQNTAKKINNHSTKGRKKGALGRPYSNVPKVEEEHLRTILG